MNIVLRPQVIERMNIFYTSSTGVDGMLTQDRRSINFRFTNEAILSLIEYFSTLFALQMFKPYLNSLPLNVIKNHTVLTNLTNKILISNI